MTRGRKEPPLVRLLDKTVFNTETGCWEWTASLTGNGYGSVHVPGIGHTAHRVWASALIHQRVGWAHW